MNGPGLLADFEFWDIIHAWTSTSDARGEFLVIFGAIFLVSFIAFLFVFFFGSRRKRRRHRHHRTYPAPAPEPAPEPEESHGSRKWFGGRRRRRSTPRPINPTLADTSGVPPARAEDEPPPV